MQLWQTEHLRRVPAAESTDPKWFCGLAFLIKSPEDSEAGDVIMSTGEGVKVGLENV